MAKKIGIANNLESRIIGGARVMFDPRKTAEVDATRDMTNRKAPSKTKKKKEIRNVAE